jgi:hypothetical protein
MKKGHTYGLINLYATIIAAGEIPTKHVSPDPSFNYNSDISEDRYQRRPVSDTSEQLELPNFIFIVPFILIAAIIMLIYAKVQ